MINKFKVGDRVVLRDDADNRRVITEEGMFACVHAVVAVDDDTISTHLLGDLECGSYFDTRFDPASEPVVEETFMYGDLSALSDAYAPEGDLDIPDFTTPADPDLKRPGYHEECSEYRACQNENNDWVIEATRRKIIAQAADEQEARSIAAALNFNTINY